MTNFYISIQGEWCKISSIHLNGIQITQFNCDCGRMCQGGYPVEIAFEVDDKYKCKDCLAIELKKLNTEEV